MLNATGRAGCVHVFGLEHHAEAISINCFNLLCCLIIKGCWGFFIALFVLDKIRHPLLHSVTFTSFVHQRALSLFSTVKCVFFLFTIKYKV